MTEKEIAVNKSIEELIHRVTAYQRQLQQVVSDLIDIQIVLVHGLEEDERV